MLETGIKAPAFSLPDQNGQIHTLEEYTGKKVILYFYPKDNTPGCTKQACNFGQLYPQFQEKGAIVLGVSKDSVASHKKFEEKYGLPFPLLLLPYIICLNAGKLRIRSFPAFRHMMYGRRRRIMGKSVWGLCGRPI